MDIAADWPSRLYLGMRSKPPRTRIEEVMVARGMRAAELARLVDSNDQSLYKVLSDPKKALRWAPRIAKALNVSIETLLEPIGTPLPVGGSVSEASSGILSAGPSIFDDDDAYAEAGRMVARALADAFLPTDPGTIVRVTRRIWQNARDLRVATPLFDRVEFVLSEEISAMLAERASRLRSKPG